MGECDCLTPMTNTSGTTEEALEELDTVTSLALALRLLEYMNDRSYQYDITGAIRDFREQLSNKDIAIVDSDEVDELLDEAISVATDIAFEEALAGIFGELIHAGSDGSFVGSLPDFFIGFDDGR